MTLPFTPNEGQRPSRLTLARAAAGELPPLEGPEAQAFAAEVEEADSLVEPFDWEVLRAAAARVEEPRAPRPAPLRRRWWVPLLALAAALLLIIRPPASDPGSTNRAKGGPDLGFWALSGGRMQPGVQGGEYRPGDRLQFSYRADGLDSLVLLSIDGAGRLTVFYPQAGEDPLPVRPEGQHILDGSILLDATLGPEVFVAVFGPSSVQEARELALGAWAAGGHAAVAALGASDPGVDTVRILKVGP